MNNPFLKKNILPYGVPAFDKILLSHYKPALAKAIEIARDEVRGIVDNSSKPIFENTIEALENSGKLISSIAEVFFNLNEADTNAEMQKLAQELSLMLTDYSNEVNLNKELFEKVRNVYEDNHGLSEEQQMLLKKTYKGFIRSGAALDDIQKEEYRKIVRELNQLSLQFGENVLAETNDFEMHLTDESDLSGLPSYVVEAAAEEAARRNKNGWVFTLHYPSYVPFMQHANKRELREKMYRAFASRGNRNNAFDNKEIIKKIVNLRLRKAQLLGYSTYAEYVLEERMAGNVDNVYKLLEELHLAASSHALSDKAAIEQLAQNMGLSSPLQRWDWAYYSEKLRQQKYNLTDEMTKPYFELDSVIKAVFSLAEELYDLTFRVNADIPVYNSEVQVFEVCKKGDNSVQSVLYLDFHPRAGKSQGAWMTTFREQSYVDGVFECPLVSLVTNFTKPTATTPSLLTFDEVVTFLHEFGHALHAMLSDVCYASLSCTNVYRDFVELPSQMHENWALEKQWLDRWAKHYETREKIPEWLIQRIIDARNFQSGYQCERQVSFGRIDMAWHTLEHVFDGQVADFEQQIMADFEPLPQVEGALFCAAFTHIFGGGYAAGYYGYKWAEVLDADAYNLFVEEGIFNKDVARKFADNILRKGGTAHPMQLYKAFRGSEPTVEPLLKRSGLL